MIFRGVALAFIVSAMMLTACDNRNNAIGQDFLPDYTQSKATSYDFLVDMQTVSADMSNNGNPTNPEGTSYNKIYVSSSNGYLGEIPNMEYGATECEYLTQVNCPPGFQFREEPLHHKVDSAFIMLYYNGFTGDTIAPVQITASRLTSPLPFDKNSISDVSPYVSGGAAVLGETSYVAGRGHGVTANGYTFIKIPIPTELGQEFYDKSRNNDPDFANQAAFDKYFSGIYLKRSAGSGSVIRVIDTSLAFYYSVNDTVKRNSTGKIDSVIVAPRVQELVHTSEVPQLSRFANHDLSELLSKSETSGYSYIKSPAGVVTEITIPTTEIKAILDQAPEGYERVLNSITYNVSGEAQSGSKGLANTYALIAPEDLLMLPKDSVQNFFAKELTDLNAPYTAYISERSVVGSHSYNFGNIASLIMKHIENNPTENLIVQLIPVERATTQTQGGANVTSSISNLVLPSAIKILTTGDNQKLTATIIERKKGTPF